MTRLFIGMAATLVILVAGSQPALAAAPFNDSFDTSNDIAASRLPNGGVFQANTDATKQAGEPNHAGAPGGASIWFRYTPTGDGPITVDTCSPRRRSTRCWRSTRGRSSSGAETREFG